VGAALAIAVPDQGPRRRYADEPSNGYVTVRTFLDQLQRIEENYRDAISGTERRLVERLEMVQERLRDGQKEVQASFVEYVGAHQADHTRELMDHEEQRRAVSEWMTAQRLTTARQEGRMAVLLLILRIVREYGPVIAKVLVVLGGFLAVITGSIRIELNP
jgi:hypothetical protein